MIVAELKGGLGNCCFMVAAAIGHAVRCGTEWGWIGTPDPTFLRLFPDLASRRADNFFAEQWTEPGFPYTEIPKPTEYDQMLRGYFQSWRYFAEPAQEAAVRAAFRLLGADAMSVRRSHLTGVHVRRGDYLAKPECHPVLPMTYYRDALVHVGARGGRYVVSDDPGWIRERFDAPAVFGTGDPAHDFLELAACWNVICANSTFSWWAAWLGRAERVVLPRPWFGPALPHDTRDLLPPWWQWLDWTPEPAKEPA